MRRLPATSTLFPYTTLFRSSSTGDGSIEPDEHAAPVETAKPSRSRLMHNSSPSHPSNAKFTVLPTWFSGSPWIDRKSTRLNSSHSQISYAVFCLKKKIHIAY